MGSFYITTPPPGNTLQYYPSVDEQASIIATSNAIDKQFYKLEQLYIKTWREKNKEMEVPEPQLHQIAGFLANLMFDTRSIVVIRDPRIRKNFCISLHAYMIRTTHPSIILGANWFEPQPYTLHQHA